MAAADLVRHADAIRLTYLTIRDRLYAPPLLANTDGDPLVFHTLKFRIDSAEKAFDALAPLAFGQSKDELLESAELGTDEKLQRIVFDWRKRGNAKIPSWDNTILGNIKISDHTLIAEVNSENRAKRLRAEIEKRLGSSVVHQSTRTKSVEEMLARAPKTAPCTTEGGQRSRASSSPRSRSAEPLPTNHPKAG